MATLTPQGQTASGRTTTLRSTERMQARHSLSAVEVLRWLRSMLDRPLTSYHLVLGSVALLLIVGVWWTIRAFIERDVNPVWWLGLIGGVLMIILAFWTSGQFFITKAYTLLVFAGIWALMQGVTDIFRAFAIRSLSKQL